VYDFILNKYTLAPFQSSTCFVHLYLKRARPGQLQNYLEDPVTWRSSPTCILWTARLLNVVLLTSKLYTCM